MDPLIVGAGPAGSAAAIVLARGGARPVIRERATETGDALCGGFLSWRTCETLRGLGVEAAGLGGHPVRELALYAQGKVGIAKLPAAGVGLSRRALDEALLMRAVAEGARIERGVRLLSLEPDGTARFEGAVDARDESLFLATGKHDVRGLPRQAARGGGDQSVGIRLRLAPSPALHAALSGKIELHLFERGYAGLVLQDGGSANLCMAVKKSLLRERGGTPVALLEALAAGSDELATRLNSWDRGAPIDTIGAVPYGWIARDGAPGRFLLGDQAACIPSLAGEGVGLALASGVMAGEHWLRGGGGSPPAFQAQFAHAAARPVMTARVIAALLERPSSARAALALVRLWPGAADVAARATRIAAR
ncbi:NAD(P)/FAD-dependent oxidoreductase [Sphingomonas mesophila]|uniref:NAD(P)/FAD-dependent oxidoreductase n=1 Tax=Sphingomonas mesophila TaxID=2303576 RepID=UPI001F07798D|nr:FAD-dependent monooxygenase [Sphingomonas mesophila]